MITFTGKKQSMFSYLCIRSPQQLHLIHEPRSGVIALHECLRHRSGASLYLAQLVPEQLLVRTRYFLAVERLELSEALIGWGAAGSGNRSGGCSGDSGGGGGTCGSCAAGSIRQ